METNMGNGITDCGNGMYGHRGRDVASTLLCPHCGNQGVFNLWRVGWTEFQDSNITRVISRQSQDGQRMT